MRSSVALTLLALGLSGTSRIIWADSLTFTTLDLPEPAIANSINDSGQIVGDWGGWPFLYDHGVFTTISANALGADYAIAYGVSNAGQIVGGTYFDLGDIGAGLGFLWDGGSNIKRFAAPGTYITTPYAINNSGEMVGMFEPFDGPLQPFVETNGTFTRFAIPDANDAVPHGINDSGVIVGSFAFSQNGSKGFVDANGVFTPIVFPGAGFTGVTGINDAGQIVGVYGSDSTGSPHGFIYSNGVFTSFDPPGSSYTWPKGINDLGQIVGSFTVGSLEYNFLATPTPVPEPASPLLIFCGFVISGLMLIKESLAKPNSLLSAKRPLNCLH